MERLLTHILTINVSAKGRDCGCERRESGWLVIGYGGGCLVGTNGCGTQAFTR